MVIIYNFNNHSFYFDIQSTHNNKDTIQNTTYLGKAPFLFLGLPSRRLELLRGIASKATCSAFSSVLTVFLKLALLDLCVFVGKGILSDALYNASCWWRFRMCLYRFLIVHVKSPCWRFIVYLKIKKSAK